VTTGKTLESWQRQPTDGDVQQTCTPRPKRSEVPMKRRDFARAAALTVAAATLPSGLRALAAAPAAVTQATTAAPGAGAGAPPLTGRLVYPKDADYDAARASWDGLFSSYPSVIVFCQTTQDVVNALSYARQTDTAFRVRSGRHALEGWSSIDGGIVIDVSPLKDVQLDRAAKTATVGTGLNQGELVAALADTGLAFPTGDEATVGLGGVLLGGGIGVLCRQMGVGCDNVLAVDTVVAAGDGGAQLVHADVDQHGDLLWASRGGGGGNFGVATSYTVRLHDLPATVGIWQVSWPFDAWADAFGAWQHWAPTADQRLGSAFNIGTPSVGIAVDGVFLGPESQVRELLKPLLAVPGAQFQSSPQKWADHYRNQNAPPPPGSIFALPNWKFTPMWVRQPLADDALGTVRDLLKSAPSDGCSFWSLSWGGAVRNVPEGGTAFVHRDPIFYSEPAAAWSGTDTTGPHLAWIAQIRAALRPSIAGGYVNVPDRAIADWGTAYYGDNFDRLRQIKATYDPAHAFSFEQGIPPA
jgi:FAD binding domain/Berberine and berberine like